MYVYHETLIRHKGMAGSGRGTGGLVGTDRLLNKLKYQGKKKTGSQVAHAPCPLPIPSAMIMFCMVLLKSPIFNSS